MAMVLPTRKKGNGKNVLDAFANYLLHPVPHVEKFKFATDGINVQGARSFNAVKKGVEYLRSKRNLSEKELL